MPRTVFPVHLADAERGILIDESKRLGVSMAEVLRRQIHKLGGLTGDETDSAPPPPARQVPSF